MKKTLMVLLLLALTGCSSRTLYGRCVGLNGKEDPKLDYEYSGWNLAIGIIFFELVVPPVIVVLDEVKCPVGYKK